LLHTYSHTTASSQLRENKQKLHIAYRIPEMINIPETMVSGMFIFFDFDHCLKHSSLQLR